MKNSNPLKYFNDQKEKRLVKAQAGMTAFQSYAKQYPNSASDTLSSNAPIFDGNIQQRALADAQKKTYGDNPVPSANPKSHTTAKGYFDKEGQQEAAAIQKAARIPQQKKGGQTKSKKK